MHVKHYNRNMEQENGTKKVAEQGLFNYKSTACMSVGITGRVQLLPFASPILNYNKLSVTRPDAASLDVCEGAGGLEIKCM